MNLKTQIVVALIALGIIGFWGCSSESKQNCNEIPLGKEHYDSMCSCITKNQLIFPSTDAIRGKLFENKADDNSPFEKNDSVDIDSSFIISFRKIIMDSSNFSWGEIGTPYVDGLLEFYDVKGKKVSEVKISSDGMLWTTPYLGITKDGRLNEKGDSLLENLFSEYFDKIDKHLTEQNNTDNTDTTKNSNSKIRVNTELALDSGDFSNVRILISQKGNKNTVLSSENNFSQHGIKSTFKTDSSNHVSYKRLVFKFDCDFQKDYFFRFCKKDYIEKEIEFNTVMPDSSVKDGFDPYKFTVTLHKQPKVKQMKYDRPVARIKYKSELDDFDYDTNYKFTLKEVKNKN